MENLVCCKRNSFVLNLLTGTEEKWGECILHSL